jgi:hypothetical protein
MASRLLEHLMTYCHHTSRAILANNLQVIKILVEVWKTRLDVPTKLVAYLLMQNLSLNIEKYNVININRCLLRIEPCTII